MIHNIDAIFDNGAFHPVEPLALPNGTRVHLHVENQTDEQKAEPSAPDPEIPTLLERMKGFVGTVHNLPSDASVNLDHYLYGTPKRQ
jgi:predicted DNA-binding antitoxin AbrB/MazE fold protein